MPLEKPQHPLSETGVPAENERSPMEVFREQVVEVGVQNILDAKDREIGAVAKKIEERYGAISLVPKDKAREDPDFRQLIELGYEKRRLEKEVLPQGIVTLLLHAEKFLREDEYIEPAAVLSSIWRECEKEENFNDHFRSQYEKYQAEKQEEIDRVQGIIDLYEERGLTDEDSQEILKLLKHQQEYANEDIRRHKERTEYLVRDIGPLVGNAKVATDIIKAAGVISAAKIEEISGKFLNEYEVTKTSQ
ncbi:MAG: hypothetical protein FJ044_01000 [Candidatus Cloacimonetes bacterium]|nr:hypothetical protein [Candidatus Cloacimonadota bacterium]